MLIYYSHLCIASSRSMVIIYGVRRYNNSLQAFQQPRCITGRMSAAKAGATLGESALNKMLDENVQNTKHRTSIFLWSKSVSIFAFVSVKIPTAISCTFHQRKDGENLTFAMTHIIPFVQMADKYSRAKYSLLHLFLQPQC